MSISVSTSAGLGILLAPTDLRDTVERAASCQHPKRSGDKFCPVCGAKVVDAFTRDTAFLEVAGELAERFEKPGEISAVLYRDHYGKGAGSRLLIGSLVGLYGSEQAFNGKTMDVPDTAVVRLRLKDILEPLSLWHDHSPVPSHPDGLLIARERSSESRMTMLLSCIELGYGVQVSGERPRTAEGHETW